MKRPKTTLVSMLFLLFIACSKDNEPPKNEAPGSFNLIAIENNASEIELSPTFKWQASTDPENDSISYDFYLDTNANPSTKLGSGLTTTSFEMLSVLDLNTTYFWKIIAKDSEGNFTESQVFKFATIVKLPNVAPSNFNLLTLADSTTDADLTPTFTWEIASDLDGDVVSYDFYMGTDSDNMTQLEANIEEPSFTLATPLLNATIYFWKVNALDGNNTTESTVFSFTTKDGFVGSINSVEDFYTPEHVAALDSLGFIFNLGDTPPDLGGIYHFSPVILEKSSVPGDFIGRLFPDYFATIANQDNNTLTIDFSGQNGAQTDVGEGTFISGEGEKFTIYLKLTSQIGSYPAESTMTISGSIGDNGFNDIQIAVLMLDNNGNVQGVYIPNNTGRFLIDQDGFSPKLASSNKSVTTRDTSKEVSSLLSSKFQE